MMPQSSFMVLAPVADGQRGALQALLDGMNRVPPIADPGNPLVPFGRFERLHFARFVILDPQTTQDVAVYGVAPPPWRVSLAFLGDCDGDAGAFLDELVETAEPGLRRIFAHCVDFGADTDLRYWMTVHTARPTASYVNWIGRTVRQIREEATLRRALVGRRANLATDLPWCRPRGSGISCSTSCGARSPRTGSSSLRSHPPRPVGGCATCCMRWPSRRSLSLRHPSF
jgi:hypothetical protein